MEKRFNIPGPGVTDYGVASMDKPVTRRIFNITGVTDYGAQVERAERLASMHQMEIIEVHDHRRYEVCNDRCIQFG